MALLLSGGVWGARNALRHADDMRTYSKLQSSFPTYLSLGFLLASPGVSGARTQAAENQGPQGYYRFPAIHGDTVVFTAEGDLWRVPIQGGMAQRLTSHLGTESHAVFSPDGKLLAFSAEYEGPTEVYTMPSEGGLPTRRTFGGGLVTGWTPDGKVLYSTRRYSTLPDSQLATIDLQTGEQKVLPLSQASEGVFEPSGKTLFFTRLPFQGSSTKRYQGGTIQHLWKFTLGEAEAVPLTEDFAGTSKAPMWWQGRIYFVSDRDGTMNLWTMDGAGRDLQQVTKHKGWDVKSPAVSEGRVVYQLGADLHLYDLAAKTDRLIPITLSSDLDQEREKWVKKPTDYLTAAHLAPDGERLVLTARGRVFVAPANQGRLVEATADAFVRGLSAGWRIVAGTIGCDWRTGVLPPAGKWRGKARATHERWQSVPLRRVGFAGWQVDRLRGQGLAALGV